MADTLVKSLGSLVQERKALQRKEQRLAHRQQQLIKDLDRLLRDIGYQLKPFGNGRGPATSSDGLVKTQARKHIKCPKCDRRFAHRLPLARNLSASHKTRQKAKKVRRRAKKAVA